MKRKFLVITFLTLLFSFLFGSNIKVDVITPNPATVNGTIIIKGQGFYGGAQNIWNKDRGGKSPGRVFLGDRELDILLYSDTIIVAVVPVGSIPGNISIETPQHITISGGFLDLLSSNTQRRNYSFMEREEYLPPAWGYYYYGGGCGWNWFVTPFGWNGWNLNYGYGEYPNVYYYRHRNDINEGFYLGYMPYVGWSYFWW